MAIQPVASLRTAEYDVLRTVVRELREASGLSQENLSKRMGRPITFIGKIETGTRRLDLIELMEISSALDIDVVKLVEVVKGRITDPRK